jgi:hypothetical protein
VAKRAYLAPALISSGGLVWAVVVANTYIVGHGGFEGAIGLLLIALGLAIEDRLQPVGVDHPRALAPTSIAGLIFIALAIGGAIWPTVWGVVTLLVLPTVFVVAPLLLSAWALRGPIRSRSSAERLIALGMLLASVASLATAVLHSDASMAASFSFGSLALALGIARARS